MYWKIIFFFGYWYYSCIRKPLTFSKEYFEKNIKLIIIIDDDIKHEKLQCSIRREAAKILALSSGKIDKHEYLIGEEILPSDQSRQQNKLSLPILLWEKHLKNKQKQLENKEKTSLSFKNFRSIKNLIEGLS